MAKKVAFSARKGCWNIAGLASLLATSAIWLATCRNAVKIQVIFIAGLARFYFNSSPKLLKTSLVYNQTSESNFPGFSISRETGNFSSKSWEFPLAWINRTALGLPIRGHRFESRLGGIPSVI